MPIVGVSASADGQLFASIAEDESVKVFDVVNFGARPGVIVVVFSDHNFHNYSDMINMLKLGFTPKACCWVHRRGQAQSILAMCALSLSFAYCWGALLMTPISSEQNSGTIRLYDGRGDGKPLETVEKLHRFPVHLMTVRFLLALVVAPRIVI